MTLREFCDPELIAPLDGLLEATGGGFDLSDIPATRKLLSGLVAAGTADAPAVGGVTASDETVPGRDGAPPVRVRVYRPDGAARAPAILWLHAGGYVLGDLELDDLMLRHMAKDVGCVVVNVEYRLAPEHPFPAALDDAYTALLWLAAEHDALDVDPGRIGVAGASAGGALAAAVALMARDRREVRLAQQLLIYPGLDDRNVEPPGPGRPDGLFWTRANALASWTAYLAGPPGGPDVPAYAAAFRAKDLSGLPPAYIAVGALDLFVAENTAYAQRLIAAGVATELHVYPGAYHAFDAFAPMSEVAARFNADRNQALVRALRPAR